MKNFKKQAIPAIFMLLMAIISLTGVSFAWFADAKKAEVKNVNIMITEASGVAISLKSNEGFARYVDLDEGTKNKILAPVSAYLATETKAEAVYSLANVTSADYVSQNSGDNKLYLKSGTNYTQAPSALADNTTFVVLSSEAEFNAAKSAHMSIYRRQRTTSTDPWTYDDGVPTPYVAPAEGGNEEYVSLELYKMDSDAVNPAAPIFFDSSIGLEAGKIGTISAANSNDYLAIELFFESTSRAKDVFFEQAISFAHSSNSTKSSVTTDAQDAIRIAFVVYNTVANMVAPASVSASYDTIISTIIIEPNKGAHLASRSVSTGEEAYYALTKAYTVNSDHYVLAGDPDTSVTPAEDADGTFATLADYTAYAKRYQLYTEVTAGTYVKCNAAKYSKQAATIGTDVEAANRMDAFNALKANSHDGKVYEKVDDDYVSITGLRYKKVDVTGVTDDSLFTALKAKELYWKNVNTYELYTGFSEVSNFEEYEGMENKPELFEFDNTGYYIEAFDTTQEYYRETAPELYQNPEATGLDPAIKNDQKDYMKKVTADDQNSHVVGVDATTAGTAKKLFSIEKGYTKVVMYVWLEGQDADCLDSITLEDIVMNFNFYCLDKAE